MYVLHVLLNYIGSTHCNTVFKSICIVLFYFLTLKILHYIKSGFSWSVTQCLTVSWGKWVALWSVEPEVRVCGQSPHYNVQMKSLIGKFNTWVIQMYGVFLSTQIIIITTFIFFHLFIGKFIENHYESTNTKSVFCYSSVLLEPLVDWHKYKFCLSIQMNNISSFK